MVDILKGMYAQDLGRIQVIVLEGKEPQAGFYLEIATLLLV